ncbi:hypothetical protein VPH35_068213 [Triticum aestivum]
MSAWRSLLSRSHPLLSRLPPVRCHARQLAPLVGNSNLIYSRGYASNPNSSGDSQAQQRAAPERHLYVVLDDHKDSYNIYKLDMDDDKDIMDGGNATSLQRLLVDEPPHLDVLLEMLGKWAKFAAVGTRIFCIGYYTPGGRVIIYDTKKSSLEFHLLEDVRDGYKAAMAAGQRLYILEHWSKIPPFYQQYRRDEGEDTHLGSLHCLTNHPKNGGVNQLLLWQWQPLMSGFSQWRCSDNRYLLMLPFDARRIHVHAVHTPPGSVHHQIYVSALVPGERKVITFTFGTESESKIWTRHGAWQLPVVGHAHYDDVLDAWLGLHAGQDGGMHKPSVMDGHLCAGNVTSAPSEWKISREKLFHLNEDTAAGWRHLNAKLVPMEPGDGGNEYCLMEHLRPEKEWWMGRGDKCLLRLTRFRVRRGEDGEPVAMARRPARSYRVSRYNEDFDVQAVWM